MNNLLLRVFEKEKYLLEMIEMLGWVTFAWCKLLYNFDIEKYIESILLMKRLFSLCLDMWIIFSYISSV